MVVGPRASLVTSVYPSAVGNRTGALPTLRRYRLLAVLTDASAGGVAAVLALLLRFGRDAHPGYIVLCLSAPVLWISVIALQRGYENRFLGTGPEEYRRLADAALVLFVIAAVASFAVKGEFSRGFLLAALPEAFVLSFLGRRRLRGWLFARRLRGDGLQRVLLVGPADAVQHLAEQFQREPWHGLLAVGACVSGFRRGGQGPAIDGVPVVGEPDSIVRAVDRLTADVVAVASHPDLSGDALRRLAWALEERGVDLLVSPGIIEVAGPRLSIRPVAGLSLLHLERPATSGGRMLVKRILDRLLAAVLLTVAAPVLLVIAIAIKVSSPGPVLFRQARVGEKGRTFQMLKFRSMVNGAEAMRAALEARNEGNGVLFKMRDDPRVTPVGAVLRRYSLDELPQLWNVLRGDMSLVGPRPPLPQEVEGYSDDATRRLRVRPGLTGLWQVSGRSDLSWEESLRLDLRYVDNWSLALDASILWRTWRAVASRSGAY
ncbi:MAG TPA: sugar transferase [Kineosporiaceae bacterium]